MNEYNPNRMGSHKGFHQRRSIRLKGYDYSQAGLYFVTICCQNRVHLFGKIDNGIMALNNAGKMIETEWLKLPQRFTNIKLHNYIVMPNHFHAILEIVGAIPCGCPNVGGQPQGIAPTPPGLQTGQSEIVRAIPCGCPDVGAIPCGCPNVGAIPCGCPKKLGDIVGAFESITTVKYIHGVKTLNWKSFNKRIWQRNYWEHIIRNENEFIRISEYIRNNAIMWNGDKLNGGVGNVVMESPALYNEENWMI